MAPSVSASLPGSVTAGPGRGALDTLIITSPAATAEIVLQGAHVTAWTPAGHDPVIWTSQHSAFAVGQPIRGGIPVCFPWFGPGPVEGSALHGFARTSTWSLVEAVEDGDDVRVVLALTESDVADRSGWPHPFSARLTVTVGQSLTVALGVTNTGPQPITFQESLHTYLAVGDIREVEVRGLEAVEGTDRLAAVALPPEGAPLRISAETDRVYPQPGRIDVVDPVLGRTLAVTAEGSGNAVLWNPWVAKAAAMPDFGDDEWSQMLCVETCNVLDRSVTLAPGASASMGATYSVARST